MKKETTFAK